jgi:hypothetical protein
MPPLPNERTHPDGFVSSTSFSFTVIVSRTGGASGAASAAPPGAPLVSVTVAPMTAAPAFAGAVADAGMTVVIAVASRATGGSCGSAAPGPDRVDQPGKTRAVRGFQRFVPPTGVSGGIATVPRMP